MGLDETSIKAHHKTIHGVSNLGLRAVEAQQPKEPDPGHAGGGMEQSQKSPPLE